MFRDKMILALAASAAVSGLAAQRSSASVLLLAFGNTTGTSAITAGNLTNSPGYASGAWTSQATTTWNPVGDADIASGVKYYDGSTATGVAIGLAGATTSVSGGNPATITFGGSSLPNGGKSISNGPGVYATGTPANGVTFESGGSGFTAAGVNVSGLAAGTYSVYVVSVNYFAVNSTSEPADVWINATTVATDPTSTAYAIPPLSNGLVDPNTAGATSTWTQNTNFVETTVTISASTPALTIVAEGAGVGGAETRGFLNSVEIVPLSVPEPATAGLLVATTGLLLRRGHRRRSGAGLQAV
jgi:hypothetical protein